MELLTSRTARQKESASRIYEELKAGGHVEDIEHLIARLRQTAIEDAVTGVRKGVKGADGDPVVSRRRLRAT